MKTRTFTVLWQEDYDPANGVVMTDEEAIKELRDALQDASDAGYVGGMFLIIDVKDGDDNFWTEWGNHSGTQATQG